jgi:hypothetical protein
MLSLNKGVKYIDKKGIICASKEALETKSGGLIKCQ